MTTDAETTAIQFTFAGGEFDVGLRRRMDWQKRDSGAALILNGTVTPTGGVRKRPGFRYINTCLHDDKPITLVEFEFSADQVYMLEFGENVMRVYWDGALVLNDDDSEYRVATPYTAEQATQFRYAQDRDALFFAHKDVTPQRLTRFGHADWRWAPMFVDVTRIQSPTGIEFYDAASNGHNDYEYAVTAYRQISGSRQESIGYQTLQSLSSTADFIAQTPKNDIQSCILWIKTYKPGYGHMAGFPTYPETMDLSDIPEDARTYMTVQVGFGVSNLYGKLVAIYKTLYPNMLAAGLGGNNGNYWWNFYHEEPNGNIRVFLTYYHKDFPNEHFDIASWYLRNMAIDYINDDLVIDGTTKTAIYNKITAFIANYNSTNGVKATNRIKWRPIGDALGYYVYRRKIGGEDKEFRRVGDVSAANFLDDIETTVPETYTPVPGENSFTNPDDYPAVVYLYQQRLLYAQTKANPSSIYGSHVGIYTDFSINPSDDSSGFEFRLSSQKLNAVEDMVALRKLICLTSGSEFINDINGAMTAKNINMVQQSSTGASLIPAVIVDNLILRVPRDKRSIESLEYSLQNEGFVGNDLLYFARHLMAERTITDLAYQRQPKNLIWVVLDDGQLLSCTFIPAQEFLGWTRHRTSGEVQSVATITNSRGHHDMWIVVRRTLGDGTTKQYLERMEEPLSYSEEADAVNRGFYVDSGLSGDFGLNPVSRVGGLDHLEGLEVAVLADGSVLAPRKVVNGEIALDAPARFVQAGLPYEFRLRTLDLELGNRGTLRNVRRRTWQATVELYMTRELWYRANDGEMRELEIQRGTGFGLTPPMLNGDAQLNYRVTGTKATDFEFLSQNPVPCGILSLIAEVEAGSP